MSGTATQSVDTTTEATETPDVAATSVETTPVSQAAPDAPPATAPTPDATPAAPETDEEMVQRFIDEATGVTPEKPEDKPEEKPADKPEEKPEAKKDEEEEEESDEDKAAKLRHDDYTRKTQALAEEKKAFEAEKAAALAEIAAAKEAAAAKDAEATAPTGWQDLPLLELPDDEIDEEYVAATEKENARISAINHLGKQGDDVIGVIGEMFKDVTRIILDNTYHRTQQAINAEYKGIEVTRESFNQAIAPIVKGKGAFAYRELMDATDEELRGIFKASNSEVIIKGLEDKVKNKPVAPVSKPPATVNDAASGNATQPDQPKEDWNDPAYIEWWIANQAS